MLLAEELLEHARFLANLDAPYNYASKHQASDFSCVLFRVFHLLAAEVAAQVSPDRPVGLRERTQRALNHTRMVDVAQGVFAGSREKSKGASGRHSTA